ncbi:MAG: lipocalin family protein [Lamprobacter sp.]|uniref:lipocalin family protein n=1 Tax=Lamprobacter sp. TaxID=3100796 RepID=UPI002B25F757|nr:lipocalin family protein [Lamprobacter sp.]MEA3642503.1 lipocalin family protein [Lamprobacter sp.]
MIKRLLFALRALLPGRLGKSRPPPATVAQVDLDRLLGAWFEVARLPNLEADGPWQHSVNVTATYTKGPDGRLSVQTVAQNAKAGMRRSEVTGSVHPADPSGSKLILRFFKLIRGDLWVIGLDPDYRWALMGTPSRRRLWLIARTPHIEPDDFEQAMAIAVKQGYEAARVRPTQQQVAA